MNVCFFIKYFSLEINFNYRCHNRYLLCLWNEEILTSLNFQFLLLSVSLKKIRSRIVPSPFLLHNLQHQYMISGFSPIIRNEPHERHAPHFSLTQGHSSSNFSFPQSVSLSLWIDILIGTEMWYNRSHLLKNTWNCKSKTLDRPLSSVLPLFFSFILMPCRLGIINLVFRVGRT